MSHQGQDGWYPICVICNGANLGSEVVCKDCYREMKANYKARQLSKKEIIKLLEDNLFKGISYLCIDRKNGKKLFKKDTKALAHTIFKAQKEKLSK